MTAEIVLLSKAEALTLTDRIRANGEALAADILAAHEGEAWRPLGYRSWTAYVEAELPFARARSYQLLTQAKVNQRLADAGSSVRATEREARDLSTTVDTSDIEQSISVRRESIGLAKPEGKKRGYSPPEDQARRMAEQIEGWGDQQESGYPLPPVFARSLERIRDAAAGMLFVAG
jgi:hypothetical protein